MDNHIEDTMSFDFIDNQSKNAIYQASWAILESMRDIEDKGLSILNDFGLNNSSLVVDFNSLDVNFYEQDYLNVLQNIVSDEILKEPENNVHTLSALISLHLIQDKDLEIAVEDCPHSELVKKLIDRNFKFNPFKRGDGTLNNGFYSPSLNIVSIAYIPTDIEGNIERRIERRIRQNTETSTETELAQALINFPSYYNQIWFRNFTEDSFRSKDFVTTLVHEYIHLLHYKISSEKPPDYLAEAFARFAAGEILEKASIISSAGNQEVVENGDGGYIGHERINWIIDLLREKYEIDNPDVDLLLWLQRIMQNIEGNKINRDTEGFLRYFLPERLKKRMNLLNKVFNEDLIHSYEKLWSDFSDFENYYSQKENDFETKLNNFEEVPEELKDYFESYEMTIKHMGRIEKEMDLTGEDLSHLRPKLMLKRLSSDLIGEGAEKEMDIKDLEREFEKRLEEEISSFQDLHQKLVHFEQDIENKNIEPERLSEKFRKEMISRNELNEEGLVILQQLFESIGQFLSQVEEVENELEQLKYPN